MAAVTSTETVTITINDIEIQVPKGELIVESVKRLGLEIPIFCYHPRMKPVGMCRMCLVDVGYKQPDGSVRKMPKPQAGCTLPASDGLVVYTDSEQVHRDRKGVLELLLINHPLDCPICDRGGECPLQNNTLAYGPSTTRFIELKRHLPKAFPLSQYVTLDLERCIQCGRCVRFTEEISGDAQLAFRFRGASMQPTTYQLSDFESKFSGNVIEICPVGALTSAKYRFRARPWDLETRPGLCTLTPDGTNVWYDYRSGKLIRINGRTNEQVNEEWTCDRTKFGADAFYNAPDRLKAVNVREGVGFRGATWSEAYGMIEARFRGEGAAVLASAAISNEAYELGRQLLHEALGCPNTDARWTKRLLSQSETFESAMGVESVQIGIADLEQMQTIVSFGTALADEQPMTYLRVRKSWFHRGTKVIAAHVRRTEEMQFAEASLIYRPGTERTLAAGLAALAGAGAGPGVDAVVAETGVDRTELERAGALLRDRTFAILTTQSLWDGEQGLEAARTLAALAQAKGGHFNALALGANSEGARAIGFEPGANGLNSWEMLRAAADGRVKALWLVGCDPLTECPDRELAERALENVEFLVVQHWRQTEACAYASVVLPMALPAETDGTYTSSERRVQRMKQILSAPGESKAPWRVFAELLLRVRPGAPYFSAGEVMDAIRARVPAFAGCGYDALDGEGVRLSPSVATVTAGAGLDGGQG